MSDLYLTENGDLALSADGDLAMVDSPWRDHSQQAYIRLRTVIGDYLLYPGLGADLERLIGMPQTKETGDFARFLVLQALTRDSVLASYPIDVKVIPVSMQGLRIDVYITAGNRKELLLSVFQDLGSDAQLPELES